MVRSPAAGLPVRRLGVVAGAAGLLGGAALVAAEALSTVGPLILVPYALLVLGTALVLQRRGEGRTAVRFAVILAAFMLATVLLVVYIAAADPAARRAITPSGYASRLGLMLGIGAVVSAIAALLDVGGGSARRVSVRSGAPTA